jgi:hypothetical protein
MRRTDVFNAPLRTRVATVSIVAVACGLFGSSALAADVEHNPDRNAYFGETHQHTSWSFDAYIFGNHITGPADAYKYYTGETIKHPLGYDIKIETPLDFAGVTDHSEYAGVVRLSNEDLFMAGHQHHGHKAPHQAVDGSGRGRKCVAGE